MNSVQYYLEKAVEMNASDIFIVAGQPMSFKCSGSIIKVEEEKLCASDSDILVQELYNMALREIPDRLNCLDDDFSVSIPDLARFRINVYKQRGSLAAIIRVVKFGIPNWENLSIPEEVMSIAKLTRGLILFTGPTGSGKSTTLACIVDAINKTRNAHIITIEDPIEYLHRNIKSIVSQRELSMDTDNYVTALRASLRQAPDVILVGEMRDLETIQIAMTAAETGHLVISTLHTIGAANTIDRIIDVFPSQQQQQIRVQISQVLKTVVSQQLIPSVSGDLIPVFEVMHLNNAIRSMVRENRVHQIDGAIHSAQSEGMISMDDSILKAYKSGKIDKETALSFCISNENIKNKL